MQVGESQSNKRQISQTERESTKWHGRDETM